MTVSTSPLKVAIFGGKGGGGLAAQTLLRLAHSGHPYLFAGYLNDRLPVGSALYGGKVLCAFDAWSHLDADVSFLAPVHKIGYMQQHSARILELGVPLSRWAKLIDPRADVAEDAEIGSGSIVSALATVSIESTIGAHCYIRAGAAIGHDGVVGDFVFVGTNATVLAGCCIKTGAHIAPGAVVRGYLTVGRFAVVGLGAVVTKNVPDYALVTGNPARVQRMIDPIDVPS